MRAAETGIGAHYLDDGQTLFRLWAPLIENVEVHIFSTPERYAHMECEPNGYHTARIPDCPPGTRYLYRLNGHDERPDPASRAQWQGDVHGPSVVVDPGFAWDDTDWRGLPLKDYVVYELHVGVYTEQGRFEAVIPHLADLKNLGITAIEIMPVAQFPGSRNWGYDGVYPFAVQDSYGGAQGLKTLVNACHKAGLAVILDVVYNHLGPEGNYLACFAPYFTGRYQTPWGWAVNYDGEDSDDVRRYFIANALQWVRDFHIDSLRLDAVHAIMDQSPAPFLQQLAREVHAESQRLGRPVYLFPESNLNDARLARKTGLGGLGLDCLWNDDFHHALHTLLTGELDGYYQDYGKVAQLAKALRQGFTYTGEYSAFRRRSHGNACEDIPGEGFLICNQNHDQVGNRCNGERLSSLISFEALKLAAGITLLAPYIPLIFMGEEYGEKAPFPYFVSHGDKNLVEAVRKGRAEEFQAFHAGLVPPDPQDEATYQSAKLSHAANADTRQQTLHRLYHELLRLRRKKPVLANLDKNALRIETARENGLLIVHRQLQNAEILILCNLSENPLKAGIPITNGSWRKILDCADTAWLGPGSTVPAQLTASQKDIQLDLPGSAFILFDKEV